MQSVSYSELRQHLASMMDRVCDDRAPLMVTRQSASPVVMVSLDEWESIEETLHLLRSPANARALQASIAELEAGQGIERDLAE